MGRGSNKSSGLRSVIVGPESFKDKAPPPIGVFHSSGHLVDQGLLHSFEKDKKQLDWTDLLKGLPSEAAETIDLGIRLSAAEDALKITLERLLFEQRSANGLGNYKPTSSDLMGKSYIAPRLLISFQELTREHTKKKKPSGRDLEEVRLTLESLRKKEHLLKLKRKDKDGNESRIIEYTRLIVNYIEGYERVSATEAKEIDTQLEQVNGPSSDLLQKGSVLLTFNPIFALDIDRKYIKRPNDLNERTLIACGKNNKPAEAIRRLRDYLLSQLTNPVTKTTGRHEVGREKLIYIVGLDKAQKEGRKSRVEQRLLEAFQACQHEALPLIEKVEESFDIAGEPKYIFTLNKAFPTPVATELLRQSKEYPEEEN
jgi:hypothetical protein